MAFNRGNGFVVNEEQITALLEDTLRSVENAGEEEVKALNAIKKLFKKVPFSRRKYVTAMLVKQAILSGRASRFARKDDRRGRYEQHGENRSKFEAPAGEKFERAPRVRIDKEVSTSIFVSVGKYSHVYKKDIVGLLVSVANLDHDRIGDIRLFPKYSFVQLYKEDCQKVIDALNGYEYRGRKLSVDYAQQKGEENQASFNADTAEEKIPSNVTNAVHGTVSESAEADKIAAEQTAFAASMASTPVVETPVEPYAETADDGQVKSHFGDGAAY
ncbi:DbpA RNA binding domain-containing protein [Treponema sp.]|uniref:DbpA RNA binding domain-containing protein n=1 Tax=Treponema sp. TaxID=166 RepID=UPI0025D07251|nr:DbpA RNA binding domain-containing protein [Treponema sp.]MCR5217927.1 DbpA RNA binding domain-containing protein [Treponema sp.]